MIFPIRKRADGPGRERLREATAKRDGVRQALLEAEQKREGLLAVDQVTNDAVRAAEAARRQEAEGKKRWLDSGCTYSTAKEHHALAEAAAAATRTAQRAIADAELVRNELVRVEDSIASLRIDLRGWEEAIGAAIGEVIVNDPAAVKLLAEFERAAELLRAKRCEVRALLSVVSPAWNDDQRFKSSGGANLIFDAIDRAEIKPWDAERSSAQARDSLDGTRHDQDRLDRLAAPWRARGADLLEESR